LRLVPAPRDVDLELMHKPKDLNRDWSPRFLCVSRYKRLDSSENVSAVVTLMLNGAGTRATPAANQPLFSELTLSY
jgi:hypothetical protein